MHFFCSLEKLYLNIYSNKFHRKTTSIYWYMYKCIYKNDVFVSKKLSLQNKK